MGAEVYRNAGRLCESRGHINAAIAQYQKGLQVAPNDVMTLISFARLRDRGGQFEEAISLYQRAIREDPNNAAALNDLGLCYARKGDCQNSLAAIGRAVQLQPDRALYRDNIATVLARLGRPEEALAHLSTVHPPAVAYYNTAYLLCRNGRGDLAISYLTRSLQHDPNLAPAQQMLARLGAPQPFQAEPPCFDTGRESIGARRAGEAGGNEPIRLLPPVAELGA
jgi:tetratricopeptide (TPR) repeat protein